MDDDCDMCGKGPMAGSGCPLHDPFTVLLIGFCSVIGLVAVIAVVGTLMGY
jgi:hypothetical protein